MLSEHEIYSKILTNLFAARNKSRFAKEDAIAASWADQLKSATFLFRYDRAILPQNLEEYGLHKNF